MSTRRLQKREREISAFISHPAAVLVIADGVRHGICLRRRPVLQSQKRGAHVEARSGGALGKALGLSETGCKAGGEARGWGDVGGWPGHAPQGPLEQCGRPRVCFSPAAEKSLVFG